MKCVKASRAQNNYVDQGYNLVCPVSIPYHFLLLNGHFNVSFLLLFFHEVLRPFQYYFSSYETSQSVGETETGEPTRKKHPTHPQAKLGLSHMWPERGSNPHQTQR